MMHRQYIADACALIAFYINVALTPKTRELMQTSEIIVSAITVWEITRKAALGKLPAQWGEGALPTFLDKRGFRQLPVTWSDAAWANQLPMLHNDPLDRILIAQALLNDMTVITDDRVFARYGVKTVW
jgi:PIN domain nuclease of toxin-antitoxin system